VCDDESLGSEPTRRIYRLPLPKLRIGSELITRTGVVFKVLEAVVLVADGGGESHIVVVERIRTGQVAQLMMTVGALANLTRGATLRRGRGLLIDWAKVARRRHGESRRMSVYRPREFSRGGSGFNK
jgi:hypothetical protein